MLRKLPTKTLSADLQLAHVRAHFEEHGAALCNAAGLIDGQVGTARVLRLMSGLREASRLDRRRGAGWSICIGFCLSTPSSMRSSLTCLCGCSSTPPVPRWKSSACWLTGSTTC